MVDLIVFLNVIRVNVMLRKITSCNPMFNHEFMTVYQEIYSHFCVL